MLSAAAMEQSIRDFFVRELMQNSLGAYMTSALIAVGGVTLVWVARYFITRRVEAWVETGGHGRVINRKLAAAVINAILILLLLLPCYWAFNSLVFSKGFTQTVDFCFLVLLTLCMVRVLANLAGFVLDMLLHKTGDSASGAKALMPIVRTVIWILGIVFLLDNLGFQISSIVAGLGIMGVAVGLAGQAILSDFFSYLVIIMDNPFGIGDTISVGGQTGTVLHIGIKTTRVLSSTGEVLVFPNADLTKQRLSNYTYARKRATTIKFGIAYETPLDQIKAVPDMARAVAESVPGLIINRVHFKELGDYALLFEAFCHVEDQALAVLLDAQQAFLLGLMERFSKEKIDIVYPISQVLLKQVQ